MCSYSSCAPELDGSLSQAKGVPTVDHWASMAIFLHSMVAQKSEEDDMKYQTFLTSLIFQTGALQKYTLIRISSIT